MIRTNSQGREKQYYARYLAHYTKKNYALLALGLLFVCGVIMGTLLIRTAQTDTLELLLRVVNGYVEKRREQTLLQNFMTGAGSSLLFVLVLLGCGFCAVSQPIVVLVPLFRGLGYGFSVASLYANYGTRAIGFVALFVLPNMIFSTLAILVCCRESLRLSGSFFGALRQDGGNSAFYSLRIYLGRYTVAAGLCVLSALVEAGLYFAFAKFFVLR